MTLIGKVGTKHSEFVSNQLISLFEPIKDQTFTMTSDNGTEFSKHEYIAEKLDVEFYFANPYHSWERGLNENTNGLIRQYLPKKISFQNISDAEIELVMNRLNNRPRKSLDYKTPNEIWREMAS